MAGRSRGELAQFLCFTQKQSSLCEVEDPFVGDGSPGRVSPDLLVNLTGMGQRPAQLPGVSESMMHHGKKAEPDQIGWIGVINPRMK